LLRLDSDQGFHFGQPGLRALPSEASSASLRVNSWRPRGKATGSSNARCQPVAAIRRTSHHPEERGGLFLLKPVGARTFSLNPPISAFAYAASRSEGSERGCALKRKSGGNFLSEFILAYTAPGERFSCLAIKPTLILEATSSRNWTSSAGVHRRPAGRGSTVEKFPN